MIFGAFGWYQFKEGCPILPRWNKQNLPPPKLGLYIISTHTNTSRIKNKSMWLQSPAPIVFFLKKMDSRTQSSLKIIFPTLITNCMRTDRIQLHMALHFLSPLLFCSFPIFSDYPQARKMIPDYALTKIKLYTLWENTDFARKAFKVLEHGHLF